MNSRPPRHDDAMTLQHFPRLPGKWPHAAKLNSRDGEGEPVSGLRRYEPARSRDLRGASCLGRRHACDHASQRRGKLGFAWCVRGVGQSSWFALTPSLPCHAGGGGLCKPNTEPEERKCRGSEMICISRQHLQVDRGQRAMTRFMEWSTGSASDKVRSIQRR